MAIEQEIGSLNFNWSALISKVNREDEWDEELFIDNIVKSAELIKPYITDSKEVTLPRIVVALSQTLIEYAKATPVLPWIKYQAASLYLASEVASWLNKTENLIDDKMKNLSRDTIYTILDKYEKHMGPDGTLQFTFYLDNE